MTTGLLPNTAKPIALGSKQYETSPYELITVRVIYIVVNLSFYTSSKAYRQ